MELQSPDKIFHFGASPSMVDKWQSCRRMWWVHYVAKKLRTEREASKDSGTAFHHALQRIYTPGLPPPTFEELATKFKEEFPEHESTEKRDQAHCLEILKKYLEFYPVESEPFKVLTLEEEIRVPVEGCVLPLNIKIDARIEWMNGLWAMDHKTTNYLGQTYFNQFRHNWQTYTYTYGVGKAENRKCEGVLYNVIGMKKKIDKESFLRKEFPKMDAQIKYHMGVWAKVVNEMYEFVNKYWQDPEAFLMSPGATKLFTTNSKYVEYCEFNGNEKFLD